MNFLLIKWTLVLRAQLFLKRTLLINAGRICSRFFCRPRVDDDWSGIHTVRMQPARIASWKIESTSIAQWTQTIDIEAIYQRLIRTVHAGSIPQPNKRFLHLSTSNRLKGGGTFGPCAVVMVTTRSTSAKVAIDNESRATAPYNSAERQLMRILWRDSDWEEINHSGIGPCSYEVYMKAGAGEGTTDQNGLCKWRAPVDGAARVLTSLKASFFPTGPLPVHGRQTLNSSNRTAKSNAWGILNLAGNLNNSYPQYFRSWSTQHTVFYLEWEYLSRFPDSALLARSVSQPSVPGWRTSAQYFFHSPTNDVSLFRTSRI